MQNVQSVHRDPSFFPALPLAPSSTGVESTLTGVESTLTGVESTLKGVESTLAGVESTLLFIKGPAHNFF